MALNNEDIKQLIAILQRGLDSDVQTEEPQQKPKKNKQPKRQSQHKITKQSDNKHNNSFLEMPEFSMHKEDSKVDKLLCKQPPVARSRSYKPMIVSCRVCGRKEEVNPALITEGAARYKCNKCSTSEG